MQPTLAKRGKILWESAFDKLGAIPPETKLGELALRDGALRLEERPADHHQAAVTLFPTATGSAIPPLTEFIMQAEFMSEGAHIFQFGFNRVAGLAQRAPDGKHWKVAPHCLTIAFNQPVDPAKNHNWLVDDNSVEPFVNLGTQPLTIEPGIWYRILIEIKGDEVCVQLSNGQAIRGKAKKPSDPKSGAIVRCQSQEGKGVLFQNIRIWAAE